MLICHHTQIKDDSQALGLEIISTGTFSNFALNSSKCIKRYCLSNASFMDDKKLLIIKNI
jgi:hypothetical protein